MFHMKQLHFMRFQLSAQQIGQPITQTAGSRRESARPSYNIS